MATPRQTLRAKPVLPAATRQNASALKHEAAVARTRAHRLRTQLQQRIDALDSRIADLKMLDSLLDDLLELTRSPKTEKAIETAHKTHARAKRIQAKARR